MNLYDARHAAIARLSDAERREVLTLIVDHLSTARTLTGARLDALLKSALVAHNSRSVHGVN